MQLTDSSSSSIIAALGDYVGQYNCDYGSWYATDDSQQLTDYNSDESDGYVESDAYNTSATMRIVAAVKMNWCSEWVLNTWKE